MSKKQPDSKRSRGVDRHTMPRVAFHMPETLYRRLKAHLESLSPRPAESEVLRVALQKYLDEADQKKKG